MQKEKNAAQIDNIRHPEHSYTSKLQNELLHVFTLL